ncbi:hypothetical protein BRD17_00675 [Halobacteriales archaeon SW_7_68_16]|nr:MAG: hypothetical protein BRD17_00675 [Halobacteriales archaeon SW_7_68_16]
MTAVGRRRHFTASTVGALDEPSHTPVVIGVRREPPRYRVVGNDGHRGRRRAAQFRDVVDLRQRPGERRRSTRCLDDPVWPPGARS